MVAARAGPRSARGRETPQQLGTASDGGDPASFKSSRPEARASGGPRARPEKRTNHDSLEILWVLGRLGPLSRVLKKRAAPPHAPKRLRFRATEAGRSDVLARIV